MVRKKIKQNLKQGSMLPLYTFIGALVAILLFLITFITTQKAQTPNPRSNLHIPIPQPPVIPHPTPKPRPSPSAKLTSPPPIEIPQEEIPNNSTPSSSFSEGT